MSEEISIGDLVHLIAKLSGKDVEIKTETDRVRPANSEVERLFCDNKKIMKHTDWKPNYTLETGILETIEWLKHHISYYKADIYNV